MDADIALYMDRTACVPHFSRGIAENEEAQIEQLVRATEHLFREPGLDPFHRLVCRTLVEQVFVTTFTTGEDGGFDTDPAIQSMLRNPAIPLAFWEVARPFFDNARTSLAP